MTVETLPVVGDAASALLEARRGADLLVVGTPTDADEIKQDRVQRLDSLVRTWNAKCPDVHATEQVATGTAGGLVIAAADSADLLVVGARRHGDGRRGLRIGPVADTMLHHSPCPVAVVPLD